MVLSAGAAAAPAAPPEQHYPGERPADALVGEELGVALLFWQHVGLTGCPSGIHVYFADSLDDPRDPFPYDVGAAERAKDCQVWLLWPYLAGRSRVSPYVGLWDEVAGLSAECTLVVHGTGHALGLAMPRWDGTRWIDTHPDHGVMAHFPEVPRVCQRWAWHAAQRHRLAASCHRRWVAFSCLRPSPSLPPHP
jgi:hypothetical protein